MPVVPPSDSDLLALFRSEPRRAWELFLERYADFVWTELVRMGFDHDETADRFVYVCEKLAQDGFRRLRTVRHLGTRGELTPWLRRVVKNLTVNWAWSRQGRRRLLRPIERLPPLEQRVFQLHFWGGRRPHEILAELRREGDPDLGWLDVHDALERVLATLSAAKLWRLRSQLERRRAPLSWEDLGAADGPRLEPVDRRPDPEATLLAREAERRLSDAFASLPPRQRLIVALRHEEGLAPAEIAEVVQSSEREVHAALKRAREALAARLR